MKAVEVYKLNEIFLSESGSYYYYNSERDKQFFTTIESARESIDLEEE